MRLGRITNINDIVIFTIQCYTFTFKDGRNKLVSNSPIIRFEFKTSHVQVK